MIYWSARRVLLAGAFVTACTFGAAAQRPANPPAAAMPAPAAAPCSRTRTRHGSLRQPPHLRPRLHRLRPRHPLPPLRFRRARP